MEIATGVISAANGLFTVGTNFWKLLGVDDDLKICLRLLKAISEDVDYSRRLRGRKFNPITSNCSPEDLALMKRIEGNIGDLELAAKEMGRYFEATRVGKIVDGSISIASRFDWVFRGKDKFIAQQWTINAVHNRVLQSITTMEARLDFNSTIPEPPKYEDIVLMSPFRSRTLKGKRTRIVEFQEEESLDEEPSSTGTSESSCSVAPPCRDDEFTEEDMLNARFLERWKR